MRKLEKSSNLNNAISIASTFSFFGSVVTHRLSANYPALIAQSPSLIPAMLGFCLMTRPSVSILATKIAGKKVQPW